MSLHQATMQPVSAALGLEIEPAVAQPALGQVPAVPGAPPANPLPAAPNGATNAPTRVQAVQKRERRVTRSSRGGVDHGNSATVPLDSEGRPPFSPDPSLSEPKESSSHASLEQAPLFRRGSPLGRASS